MLSENKKSQINDPADNDRGQVISRGQIHDEAMFKQYGCRLPTLNPPTPNLVRPDAVIDLQMYMGRELVMADGKIITMWVFYDPKEPLSMPFPSLTIRVRQGQIVHTRLDVMHRHTIHHHGIEPTPFNDGVGHTSFQVDRRYTYQWYASQAGTYLYHCHVNTVLHLEMGMYGFLIIDPPEGPGRAYSNGPAYDVEAFWVADEIDPRWHELDEHAGLACPFASEDPGLNKFEPKYFLITGVPHPLTRTDSKATVTARAGETILIRVANAGYTIQEFTIHGLGAQIVSMDGRPLDNPYSEPISLPPGTPFELTTAQRLDLILRPERPGIYPATIKFRDWITRDIRGVAETFIYVRAH